MNNHLRANLWLLASTVLLCCVIYPAIVWTFSQTFFHSTAKGSLVDKYGRAVVDSSEAVGSQLIAQPFNGPEYFHPRPSAVSYNAAASGGSNFGANNYQLRLRVAKALGPIVKYGPKHPKSGQPVGPDIEQWFRDYPLKDGQGVVAQWAKTYPSAAVAWTKDNKANAAYIEEWKASHADDVANWVAEHPATPEPKPEDLAVEFFVNYSREHPATFPAFSERIAADGHAQAAISPVTEGADIQANFFEMWLDQHTDVDLEQVPGDMVMTSGSGLDPHITLSNALFQVDRVANERAHRTNRDPADVRQKIESLLRSHSHAPLGGLAGVPLVNVLEINLALNNYFGNVRGP
jgi:potassium-transporting ATPase KdpC subunit